MDRDHLVTSRLHPAEQANLAVECSSARPVSLASMVATLVAMLVSGRDPTPPDRARGTTLGAP